MENAKLLRSTGPYHHRSESSIQFSDSDKFFCKLLEKETDECINTSRNPSSFRVCYGGSKSSVPFFWETAPGTPKHTLSLDKEGAASVVIRPLTPPPRHTIYGSGSDTVKRGPRKVLEGLGRRIRSSKAGMLHFKCLFETRWRGALGGSGKGLGSSEKEKFYV